MVYYEKIIVQHIVKKQLPRDLWFERAIHILIQYIYCKHSDDVLYCCHMSMIATKTKAMWWYLAVGYIYLFLTDTKHDCT